MKSKTERVTLTDRETGEQRDVTLERVAQNGRRQEGARGFAMLWIDAMIASGLDRRIEVLLLLAEVADLRGVARYSQTEFGERLGMKPTAVWRVVQTLYERDIVRRIGRAKVQINPNIVWQGPISDRSAAIIRWHNKIDAQPFDGEPRYTA